MTTGDYILTHRNSAYVPGTLVSIEGYSPDDILKGYEVEEYDLSLEAGRNASGTMHLNYVATFFNPFTGTNYTMQAYRGDRKLSMLQDQAGMGQLYDSAEQSLIEL